MRMHHADERASNQGPAETFTGTVFVDPLAETDAPVYQRVARVSFQPGARTAWHSHPRGQILHCIAGVGRVQSDGQSVQKLLPSDTVVFEPGERHWHGAAPATTMVHLAIQPADPETGSTADWFEQVSDDDYRAEPAT